MKRIPIGRNIELFNLEYSMIYNWIIQSFFCITAKNLQKSLSFLVLYSFVSISYSDNANLLIESINTGWRTKCHTIDFARKKFYYYKNIWHLVQN